MGSETDTTSAATLSRSWLANFDAAISSGDVKAVTSLFLSYGWLRDVLVFTWTHRSHCGDVAISEYLASSLSRAKIRDVKLDQDHGILPSFFPTRAQPMVEAALIFETPIAHGRGHIRLLKDEGGEWKALSVFLTLDDLKGYEEKGFESGHYEGRTKTWQEVQAERTVRIEKDPHVVIIGAAQSGLNVGARFRQMDIPTLLIDQANTVGDVWGERYPTLTLHTPNTHHSPLYQSFPRNWPKFTPRDKVASTWEQYAHNQDLIIWTRTTVVPTPSYDPSTKRWTVQVLRAGVKVTLHPHHIVLAMGTLGKPWAPRLPGQTEFKGEAYHATTFKGALPYAGKKTIVVGAGQTAADICQDLVARGAESVTMVQRSSTAVVASEYIDRQLDNLWPVHGDVSVGDFRYLGMPLGLLKKLQIAEKDGRVAEQKAMIQGLLKAGLNVDEGPEGAGAQLMVYERLGGYWLDVGAAELIIRGKIHVKQGTQPTRFTPEGVLFDDGSTLEADLVVFATGYEPIQNTVHEIFGEEIARRTSPVWGLDDEGEAIRAYTPSGHPALWYAIGDFSYSRFYSKSLALQIKAREIGLFED